MQTFVAKSIRDIIPMIHLIVLYYLLLLSSALIYGQSTLCTCFCPNRVGNAYGTVCGAQACAIACHQRYPQCTQTNTYGCCGQGTGGTPCGSYPSSNNCDCYCDSLAYPKFLGTASAITPAFGTPCARACYAQFSGQCATTQIRGCSNSYTMPNGCSYYARNYTCDCNCTTYKGTAASDTCSGSACASACYNGYSGCGGSNTIGCTSGCGPVACRQYLDIVRNTLCYCNCPSRVGVTYADSCSACTATCVDDFPICRVNNQSSWGSCSPSSTTARPGRVIRA
jgi:hypothetical protein